MCDPDKEVLGRLEGVRAAGPDTWQAFCPVHENPPDGHNRSLSVKRAPDGRALVYCHGCGKEKTPAIVEAIGLRMADLMLPKAKPARRIVATYDYTDETGALLFQVCRYDPKDFRQRRPDSNGGWTWNLNGVHRVLYRLPELVDADPATWVFLDEGEKGADDLAALGLVTTTNPGGAGKWREEYSEVLRGRRVAILPDADAPGRKHALDVARALHSKTADVRIVDLPGPGKDVTDWIAWLDSRTAEELAAALVQMADAAPVWTPDAAGPWAAAESSDAPTSEPALINLANVEPEPLRWLWPNRIPLGKVTLLFGDPGLGKSFITLDIAARVSCSMPWPDADGDGGRAAPAGVILLSAEDDVADTIRPRLDAAGADPWRVTLLQGIRYGDSQGMRHFNLASDLPALEAAIRQRSDTRLVIIDPVSAYLGRTDSHKNAAIRGLLAPLADLAAQHDVAVLTVSHMSKGLGGRALYRAMGSLAFIAAARAAWLAVTDADNPRRRLFLPAKANLTREPIGLAYTLESVDMPGIGPVGRVAWESERITMTADEALAAAAADPEDRTARESAAEWLREVLADGPMTANDMKAAAKESGISWATIRRAQPIAGVKVRRKGGRHGAWHWFLPGHVSGAPSKDGEGVKGAQQTRVSVYEENGESEGTEIGL